VYLFKPSSEVTTAAIRLKGLDAAQSYSITFADGTNPPSVRSGAELMEKGLPVKLEGDEASELVFLEAAR